MDTLIPDFCPYGIRGEIVVALSHLLVVIWSESHTQLIQAYICGRESWLLV